MGNPRARTRWSIERTASNPSRIVAKRLSAAAKELVRFVSTHDASENLQYTAKALADSWETAEIREGIDAFFNRRKPNWQR